MAGLTDPTVLPRLPGPNDVYPEVEQAYIYTGPRRVRVAGLDETLDGGDVVPGFTLPLAQLFGDDTE